MADKVLSISRRTRATPFSLRVEAAGVRGYTVYNHMLLPTYFESNEFDYWHLCTDVQVWDVSCERQIDISGPDSQRLVQLMTPRDISRCKADQGLYAPLCDRDGGIVNDPVVIKLADDHWWVSIADSDVALWADGLAQGYGLDVKVREADIWPLAVQGPKAEELVTRVFGDEVPGIRFFRYKMLPFQGREMMVMRSGYSKQGGFEIYLNDATLAEPLWDELFDKGQGLNVRAGGPNLMERIESGLLSYGNDMTRDNTPFECGLDSFVDLDADIEAISLPALRDIRGNHEKQLMGLVFDQMVSIDVFEIEADGSLVGDIRSHAWSPRHSCYLAMAMISREYLNKHSTIDLNGKTARIVDLPFDFAAIGKEDA